MEANLNMFLFPLRMYGNAVQDDLWAALTYQAELDSVQLPTDIKTIMDSWTLKMGYPVVNVIRNYTSSVITAQQVSDPKIFHILKLSLAVIY